MKKIALLILITVICAAKSEILGPFTGGVTATDAVFLLKADGEDYVAIELSLNHDFEQSVFTNPELPEQNKYGYLKFTVTNLLPYTIYYYRAVINSKPQSKKNSFRTFPASGRVNFSFGFGSCMQSAFANYNKDIFKKIGSDTLSFFIQIGDWTYPDFSVSAGYNRNWDLLTKTYDDRYDNDYGFVKYVMSKTPIAYVYDDHDFAGNNSDGTDPYKQNSIKAYDMYFPHYKLENPGNGIWQSFNYGDVEFFLLDLRSQRSSNDEAFQNGEFDPPKGHSILAGFHVNGTDQREWFINSLKKSTARWKIIVSTVVWNPMFSLALRMPFNIGNLDEHLGSLTDKWAGFPEDQKLILNTIADNNINNVIIISGDTHSSYIDDGGKSNIPEIGASNLDVENSKIVSKVNKYGFNIFNQGSYEGNGRAYGRVSFVYGTRDYALLEIVDEKGKIWAKYKFNSIQ